MPISMATIRWRRCSAQRSPPRVDGLREAVAALGVTLSTESWYRVWEASTGHPVP